MDLYCFANINYSVRKLLEMDPEADDSYMALSEPVEAADSDHGMDKWVFGFVLILAGYGLQWFCNPMLLYI